MKTVRNLAVLAICAAHCSCALEGLSLAVTPDGRLAATYTPPPAKEVPLSDKGSK